MVKIQPFSLAEKASDLRYLTGTYFYSMEHISIRWNYGGDLFSIQLNSTQISL